MSLSKASRPRFCIDALVDEYLTVHNSGCDLRMIKTLKILRAIVVNVGIIVIALYAFKLKADPTVIGSIALTVLGGYNGVELLDYQALAQALVEASGDTGENDGR